MNKTNNKTATRQTAFDRIESSNPAGSWCDEQNYNRRGNKKVLIGNFVEEFAEEDYKQQIIAKLGENEKLGKTAQFIATQKQEQDRNFTSEADALDSFPIVKPKTSGARFVHHMEAHKTLPFWSEDVDQKSLVGSQTLTQKNLENATVLLEKKLASKEDEKDRLKTMNQKLFDPAKDEDARKPPRITQPLSLAKAYSNGPETSAEQTWVSPNKGIRTQKLEKEFLAKAIQEYEKEEEREKQLARQNEKEQTFVTHQQQFFYDKSNLSQTDKISTMQKTHPKTPSFANPIQVEATTQGDPTYLTTQKNFQEDALKATTALKEAPTTFYTFEDPKKPEELGTHFWHSKVSGVHKFSKNTAFSKPIDEYYKSDVKYE